MRPEPAHLTLGRGLPAFAARLPGSVQTPKDTHRLSTGGSSLAGEATETLGYVPSGGRQHRSHFVVLCRLPRGPAWCGRGLFSPRLRLGLVGGAGALPATLAAFARALNFGCEASGCQAGGLWFLTEAMEKAYVPLPKATTGGASMEVLTAFGLRIREGRALPCLNAHYPLSDYFGGNLFRREPIEPDLAAPQDCLGSSYHSLELYKPKIHSPRVPLMLVLKN